MMKRKIKLIKQALLGVVLFWGMNGSSQDYLITGSVVDINNFPVAGKTINIIGYNNSYSNSVVSDSYGLFSDTISGGGSINGYKKWYVLNDCLDTLSLDNSIFDMGILHLKELCKNCDDFSQSLVDTNYNTSSVPSIFGGDVSIDASGGALAVGPSINGAQINGTVSFNFSTTCATVVLDYGTSMPSNISVNNNPSVAGNFSGVSNYIKFTYNVNTNTMEIEGISINNVDIIQLPAFVANLEKICLDTVVPTACAKQGLLVDRILDGCGWLIQLSNGKLLNPTNLYLFNIPLVDSSIVQFNYVQSAFNATICMAEDSIVDLTCLSIVNPTCNLDANFTWTQSTSNNQTVSFNAATVLSSNNYNWSFGDGNSNVGASVTHTYSSAGTYNVTLVVSDSNCIDSVSRLVAITTNAVSSVNNIITPNGDGIDDYYSLSCSGVQVFDRNGNLVRLLSISEIIWDGKDDYGNLVPMGSYGLVCISNTSQVHFITVIR